MRFNFEIKNRATCVSFRMSYSEINFISMSKVYTFPSNFLEINKIKQSDLLAFDIGISKHLQVEVFTSKHFKLQTQFSTSF